MEYNAQKAHEEFIAAKHAMRATREVYRLRAKGNPAILNLIGEWYLAQDETLCREYDVPRLQWLIYVAELEQKGPLAAAHKEVLRKVQEPLPVFKKKAAEAKQKLDAAIGV